ncbi:Xyloglucan endo-transglycosylase, C-terminal [Dillenia turbinata]|uniref:Xyloglucan endo-transglycosylase, C-terminal n=1 Tax=Dillenia turbinata TaxID=194707 RepID=A0AAN8ZHN1_9MAGN
MSKFIVGSGAISRVGYLFGSIKMKIKFIPGNSAGTATTYHGSISISQCAANWWTSPVYSQLSAGKLGQMNWVRQKFMVYDYCKDYKRFNSQMPPECSLPQY